MKILRKLFNRFRVNTTLKLCDDCGRLIDITKATTDEKNEFVRFINQNIYLHKSCWEKQEWKQKE